MNYITCMYNQGELEEEPIIIHYNGPVKPWHCIQCFSPEEYYKVANKVYSNSYEGIF